MIPEFELLDSLIPRRCHFKNYRYMKRFKEWSISQKNYYEETVKKDNKYRINFSDKDYICNKTVLLNIK